MKVSESYQKTTIPGVFNVRRFVDENGKLAGDMIYDIFRGVNNNNKIVDPFDMLRQKKMNDYRYFDLLQPLFKNGEFVGNVLDTMQAQDYAKEGLKALDETQKRTLNPHTYPVGLEYSLSKYRSQMVAKIRGLE